MTVLQQLSLLAVLAAAVSAPLATSAPAMLPAAAAVVARPFPLTEEAKRQIRINALHALSIDPRPEYRQQNWMGPNHQGKLQGSCAWASLVNLLHWQGEHAQANAIRARFSAGAGPDRVYPAMDAAGIPYATGEDVAFLEWACRTRRGACVAVGDWCQNCGKWHVNHMLNLVGIDPQYVYLLDNNGYRETYRANRADFLRNWTACGSWAFTPLYSPAPPKPWIITQETAP